MVQGPAPYGAPQFQAPQAAPPGSRLPPAGPPAQPPYAYPAPYPYPPAQQPPQRPPYPLAQQPPQQPPYPLAQQPPPPYAVSGYGPSGSTYPRYEGELQRPAVIAVGSTLAVVASLQWICALSLLWVAAVVGIGTFSQAGDNGAVFHILNRFNYRMLDGLAIPLYLFPLVSLVTGFLVLSRRPWTRLLHTAVGMASLGWALWWLQDDLLWWFSAAWYVVVACLVLWTPGATAWYRWREPAPAQD